MSVKPWCCVVECQAEPLWQVWTGGVPLEENVFHACPEHVEELGGFDGSATRMELGSAAVRAAFDLKSAHPRF